MIVYFNVDVYNLHKTFFSLQLILKNKISIFLKHVKNIIQKKHATFIFFYLHKERKLCLRREK